MPTTTRAPAELTESGGRAERLLKLPGLVHLHHDVGATDKLAIHVELGNGRPVRVALDALPDSVILEDVDRLQVIDAAGLQDLDRSTGEPAHRKLGGSLHEKDDAVGLHQVVD